MIRMNTAIPQAATPVMNGDAKLEVAKKDGLAVTTTIVSQAATVAPMVFVKKQGFAQQPTQATVQKDLFVMIGLAVFLKEAIKIVRVMKHAQ